MDIINSEILTDMTINFLILNKHEIVNHKFDIDSHNKDNKKRPVNYFDLSILFTS